ncbi:hypothetical protein DdX_21463 [Ditylenchus destructor]|uniref:Uncharacterized protein n=1 Tax=Ditylenchus destructor TaxID=166010 RepID=A0AAD4QRD5_9BILA|nr:hypothetical protein DdX_21463 [Ditylenchus destructor]
MRRRLSQRRRPDRDRSRGGGAVPAQCAAVARGRRRGPSAGLSRHGWRDDRRAVRRSGGAWPRDRHGAGRSRACARAQCAGRCQRTGEQRRALLRSARFVRTGRSETDPQGRPYPVIHFRHPGRAG